MIDTPDLVGAAHSLRPQLDMLHGAGEGTRKPELTTAFESLVAKSVKTLGVWNADYERFDKIDEIPENN